MDYAKFCNSLLRDGSRQLCVKQLSCCAFNSLSMGYGRRIERARTLLQTTATTLSVLSPEPEFGSQSHFTEAFRQRTGLAADCWRKTQRERIGQRFPERCQSSPCSRLHAIDRALQKHIPVRFRTDFYKQVSVHSEHGACDRNHRCRRRRCGWHPGDVLTWNGG